MATLRENYVGDSPFSTIVINAANDWTFQSFTTTVGYSLTRVDFYLSKGAGDNVGNISIRVYAVDGAGKPTGSALASGTIADSDVPESGSPGPDWITCTFSSSVNLSSATKYAIQINAPSCSASDVLYVSYDDDGLGASDFAGGDQGWSTDGGSSWNVDTTQDNLFKAWGDNIPGNDKVYTRRLIAVGNNEVWYESSSSTMTELSAANGVLNTVNPMTAAEAFQKIFFANGTTLKIADFINSKITTANVGANPPDFGTVLTGGTSSASMVVDYITTLSGACTIYGAVTTSATFVDTETVTGTDDDGNAISFTLNANEVANPHFYTWTPFGNDSSFGVMPTEAYLVTRYRGRLVLSGHTNYPHMWYMSKVGNPFNWLYAEDTRLTAVAGNNVDAGEIGDIVRALITYGDDFLIFGCANSIHLLDGDPASNGSIDELSTTTGIYSFTSWCKDDSSNLYFLGSDGIYRMDGGRARPVNISKSTIPKLIDDWALDPSLHRVVMAYDVKRKGILITKTTLADGTCTGYFYSLETDGWYPIVLDTTNGILCAFDYNSDTPADRALLLGSYDGYIREFLDSAKDDDIGDSDKAISSYFGLVENLAEDADKEGLVHSLTVELAGGESGGSFGDIDGCNYEFHKGNDAESVLEDMLDGATASETGTLSGTGRKNRLRKRVRAAWLGLKFYNSTAAETFGINRIFGMIKQVGRIK
jgi:hypothetical protein